MGVHSRPQPSRAVGSQIGSQRGRLPAICSGRRKLPLHTHARRGTTGRGMQTAVSGAVDAADSCSASAPQVLAVPIDAGEAERPSSGNREVAIGRSHEIYVGWDFGPCCDRTRAPNIRVRSGRFRRPSTGRHIV